ncbi:MAG: hypothetical protein Q7O04_07155 [Candidatus Omnitrophota bacterium]|nr:hypothetical protein [Candidatus Omnitrophota bacterium]
MEYEFNILYYINMYKKWWKNIVKLMMIAMFFTTIFSMLLPVTYVSTVSIISADTSATTASSIGKFLGISNIASSSNDIIISMLNSNRMAKDIAQFLEFNKKQNFRYSMIIHTVTAGLAMDIKGNDPALTEKVANFTIQNLDKINAELNITPSKPMAKVLDPAVYGKRESRQILRKVFIAGLLIFLLVSLYAFFTDYLKKLKGSSGA